MTIAAVGLLCGSMVELDAAIPELDGKRVRILLESLDDETLSAEEQREAWLDWVQRRPQGPIEDVGTEE